MAIQNLISTERAIQNATLAALNASNPASLTSLIASASDAICRYVNRDLTQQSYQHYYDVGVLQNSVPILLRQYPVQSISRVGIAQQAIQVQNSANSTNQRATAQTSSTALTLYTIASAVPATNILTYAAYPTIGQLAAAINAVGNGWSTNIQSGPNGSYANYPSADLKPQQGAVSAFLGGAWLEIYDDILVASGPLGSYGQYDSAGYYDWSMTGPGWRLQPETGELYIKVRRGSLILRIDYVAGYAVVPQSVQEACVQLIQWTYQNSTLNLALKSAKIEQYSYTLGDTGKWPASVLLALESVKAHDRTATY
jgi:hypothetical protein